MAILPGWNSLVAAGSIAHSLHIAAMVVLALVVVAEGMALVYDDRKYALIGAAERAVTATRDQEWQEIEERDHNEIAELQRRLEETQRQQGRLEETQHQQASRRLTITDQQTLLAALSPFPGQQIDITSIVGDPEGQQFASDFVSVAQQAGWNATGVNQATFTTNPVGVEVFYREPPPDNVPPPALAALVDALMGLHILPARSVSIYEDTAPDVIRLVVGTKPASPELHSSLSPQEPSSMSTGSDVAKGTAIDTPPGQ
jgi:hypothetical protein